MSIEIVKNLLRLSGYRTALFPPTTSKDKLMTLQSKPNTLSTAVVLAVILGTVGCGPTPLGPSDPGDIVTLPDGGFQLSVCTSTFTSNPGTVNTEPPQQTDSYVCTTNIPPCPAPYTRTNGAYGTADDSFRFVCALPVKCTSGYDLVAHQQSASKFQYKCELPPEIN